MSGSRLVLRAADGGPIELSTLVAALAAEFTTSLGDPRLERRAYLDTFDRRLARVGLHLVHRRAATGGRLELTRPDGSIVDAVAADLAWPASGNALPPGPLRDLVAPAVGIRALMVLADQRRRLRRIDVRDAQGKAVVRLELDEPVAGSGGPALLALRPVLGYDGEGRRAGRLLTAAGLERVERPRTAAELVAVGRQAPPAEPADPAEPARVALARALTRFHQVMTENLPGLIDDVDTEFLHDFRVALRRTRATLKLGRSALPLDVLDRWEPEFGWLGGVTTPVRDLDVYLLDLPEMATWLVTADAGDLAPFAAHLGRRRGAERRDLVRSLRSARFRRLTAGWTDELRRLGSPAPRPAPGPELSVGELAADAVARAHRRVVRDGAAITADSAPADLHRLRRRCKELRYALEVFAPVLDPGSRKRAVADLTALQDVLGRFQDTQVQREALEAFAAELMAAGTPVATLLAMGELIGHLGADQQRARQSFDGAFARFARRSSHHPPHALGGTR